MDALTLAYDEWKSRPQEITGFLSWVTDLASWIGLGSNAYPGKIMGCIKETEPLGWHRLQPSQITRSVRLLSTLKTCFMNHARASLVIRNYEEAKGFHRRCGFACLRLIAREFSVKTRTELLFFRKQLPIAPSPLKRFQRSFERFSPSCFNSKECLNWSTPVSTSRVLNLPKPIRL